MMSQTQAETFSDALLAFTIPSREARGRFMRFDRVLDEILSSHDYPAPVRHLLSEALVLTALIGSLVKDDSSQVTMQAQTKKRAVSLLVCDYQGGALRGYADFDAERLDQLGANPSLEALFDEGFLALTFDLAGKQGRYQGVVPLEGASLSEACQLYFAQSEQVPTLLRVAVSFDGEHCLAAGLLAQHTCKSIPGTPSIYEHGTRISAVTVLVVLLVVDQVPESTPEICPLVRYLA